MVSALASVRKLEYCPACIELKADIVVSFETNAVGSSETTAWPTADSESPSYCWTMESATRRRACSVRLA